MAAAHRVAALALPEVVAFDLSIPAQIFGHAEERDRYAFSVCAPAPGAIATTTGFAIQAPHGLEALRDADTVVVAGFLPTDDPPEPVLDALRDAHARGSRVASVCVGAFALAAAGLLDGRVATTHWDHAAALRERFPQTAVRADVLYIDEGSVLTSAGISAGIDLCLHMVAADYGSEVAGHVSRRMVAAMHRTGGQAQFIERPLPETGSDLAATCAWARERLDRTLALADLARHAGFSTRAFTRRFRAATGVSPMQWLTAERVREARRLLECTDMPVEVVAAATGLGSAANLRVHFAREVSTTPTAYRAAYRGPASPSVTAPRSSR